MTGEDAAGPPQIEALVGRGLQFHRENRLAEAEQIYREALRLQPMHSGVLHLLGLVAFQSGQAERSVALFDRAIAIRPDLAEAHDTRGTALYALNRFEEAFASYDRALRLKPDNAGALGKPVWILLPFNADWRWLRDRPDSPWYPTARLFRQAAPGAWDGVIDRVTNDLAALAARGQPV